MILYFYLKILQVLAVVFGISTVSLFFGNSALAQIRPDGSLGGTEQSEVRRGVQVRGLPGDLIQGGAVRGNNLFHSFSEFNVNDGQRVYFANPGGIRNIISRVTGNNPSNIFGTLGINGAGSLFFINPKGIVFGENAKLDIAGSFVASTAKSLVFENGFEFTTENPAQPPLLTINAPVGLQLGVNSGSIFLTGSGPLPPGGQIQLQTNQTIGLIANGVFSQGGQLQARQIEIGSVSDGSRIGITQQGSFLKFKYDDIENFANITFSDRSNIILPFRSQGDVTINGSNIIFSGNSNIFLSFGSGSVTINGNEITFSDSSDVFSGFSRELVINGNQINIDSNSYLYSFNSDNLTITTNILSVNGGMILKDGGQGDLKIEASDSIEVVGVPFQPFLGSITFQKNPTASGVGNLIISTKNLIIRAGGQILALTNTLSPGSNILINATESIEVTGEVQLDNDSFLPSRILAASGSTNLSPFNNSPSENNVVLTGPGGNLTLNTGKLTVSNGGEVTVSSTTLGDAGTLTVNADSILLDEGKITATSDNAKGGNINLAASDLLLMRDHSLISARSFGTDSQDGNITIDTNFIIALPSENSDILARATNQGNIDITANSVIGYNFGELTPFSDITASGTLTLNIPNLDPTQGLTELPGELVDSSRQIDQTCAANDEGESRFIVTGRNGLPQNPNELLTPDVVLDEFGTLATGERDAGMRVDEDAKNSPTTPSTSNSQSSTPSRPQQIIEARGWVVDAQGQVILVAQSPTFTPHTLAVTSAVCQTPPVVHR